MCSAGAQDVPEGLRAGVGKRDIPGRMVLHDLSGHRRQSGSRVCSHHRCLKVCHGEQRAESIEPNRRTTGGRLQVREQREQVRNQFRQRLIDEGIFTKEQLTAMEEWLQAKPDVLTEEFTEWMQSRPDDIPKHFGAGIQPGKRFAFGFGYHLGKGFGQGIGGWCQQGNGVE